MKLQCAILALFPFSLEAVGKWKSYHGSLMRNYGSNGIVGPLQNDKGGWHQKDNAVYSQAYRHMGISSGTPPMHSGPYFPPASGSTYGPLWTDSYAGSYSPSYLNTGTGLHRPLVPPLEPPPFLKSPISTGPWTSQASFVAFPGDQKQKNVGYYYQQQATYHGNGEPQVKARGYAFNVRAQGPPGHFYPEPQSSAVVWNTRKGAPSTPQHHAPVSAAPSYFKSNAEPEPMFVPVPVAASNSQGMFDTSDDSASMNDWNLMLPLIPSSEASWSQSIPVESNAQLPKSRTERSRLWRDVELWDSSKAAVSPDRAELVDQGGPVGLTESAISRLWLELGDD